ncbi:MAG: SEC-C domain-containing protein [Clostridiales bacterium]|nr:SEC-C domain-containing protein [Clostridiales bacterium]
MLRKMKIYETWENMQNLCQTEMQQRELWATYYQQETDAYKIILANKEFEITGTAKEIAEKFNMETAILAPFLDGINTSLKDEIDVQSVEEETEITLNIIPEKLYYNMLNAKAKWLYELKEWNDVIPEEKRIEITRAWRQEQQAVSATTVGRNDPCPCGSGKKYKKCCGK